MHFKLPLIASELKCACVNALPDLESDDRLVESNHSKFFHKERQKSDFAALSLVSLIHRIYGDGNLDALSIRVRSLGAACEQFVEHYGDGPVHVLRAPARINILGEHIDYVSYMPTASLTFGSREHDMLMLYRETENPIVRGASCDSQFAPFNFNLIADNPGSSDHAQPNWLAYLNSHPTPAYHWSNYMKSAVEFAKIKFGQRVKNGFDFLVCSTIPAGSGASSSSALVVLASAAVRGANEIEYTAKELARDAAQAEWYVGTRGGSMDHLTICHARAQHAVLINYQEDRVRAISHPHDRYRWVTVFSVPAIKSQAVMSEYNERAAVSRLIIPALIETWGRTDPHQHRRWQLAVESMHAGSSIETLAALLGALPESLTLGQIKEMCPTLFSELRRSFPALVEQGGRKALKVRKRALHHVGEIRRVAEATAIFDSLDQRSYSDEELDLSMRKLGRLLNESHASLRDLYEVSLPELEELIEIIRSDANVYGARLMGGGYGGNVLALIRECGVPKLIDKVQAEYYGPRRRNGGEEGAIMVSTPGTGLSALSPEIVWREAIEEFNAANNPGKYRQDIISILDKISIEEFGEELCPIIVAAGKGTRAQHSGIDVPKPLASILGVPSIRHVLRSVRAALRKTHTPIVIVSPETEERVRAALADEEVRYVVQEQPLGTGDAVLHAQNLLNGFGGRVLVVWSTQPAIQVETIQRSVKMAALFSEYDVVMPTAFTEFPYAPLVRDEHGRVKAARETHLEMFNPPEFGETNIGLFVLKSTSMLEALRTLKARYWDQSRQCYNRPRGELGFPNELVNAFAERETGVFACGIAESGEEQGIKQLDDIPRCERIILQQRQQTQ